MGILLEDLTSKEEYEELEIPVQPMNTKGTSSANIRYDECTINELKRRFTTHRTQQTRFSLACQQRTN
jgi:hypothetical protein